ncbi:MAG: hypothetical protein AAFR59_18755, partial [Bacteroidota bacterium]
MQPLEIFAEAFGWTLLHTLWIGVAIAAVYALILNIARPQKAQVRYGLGMGSLLVMVIGTTLVFWQSYDRVQAQREDEVRIASIDANELWLMERSASPEKDCVCPNPAESPTGAWMETSS